MNEPVTMDHRLEYWKVRALSEQHHRERLEGQVAALRSQLEAQRTQQRLQALMARLKADGILDLSEGEWMPDDEHETFVAR
jgi:hypothetical protein